MTERPREWHGRSGRDAGTARPTPDPEDADIVRRCRRGEEDAWTLLVGRHRQRVFHLAYQFVGDVAEAEDLVQEIFLRLYGSLHRFDENLSFKAWLTAVGRNYLIDHYRRHRRQRALLTGGDDALRTIPDGSPSPVGNVERRERSELLRRGLQALPEALKKAVVLRDVQGYSYEEISKALAIPVGTVKSRINRGRAELAVALKADLRELAG
ncbi:MAG: sigma-70 family RNA polymerase sigma factor [Acidobacteriota bacterium]